jgi:phosphoglycerol transferase MdoB-like AlkP superfamily enzyme
MLSKELGFLKLLVLRLGLSFFVYFVARLFYAFYNFNFFLFSGFSDFFKVLVWSLRFDCSSVLYVNSVLILLHLLPFSFRYTRYWDWLCVSVFSLTHLVVFCLEITDALYFPFSGRRILLNDFYIQAGMSSVQGSIVSEYFMYGLFEFSFVAFIVFLFIKTQKWKPSSISFKPLRELMILPFVLGLIFLGLRGGVQIRPLMPIDANKYASNYRLYPLISNTTLGLIHASQQRFLEPLNYMSDEEAERLVSRLSLPSSPKPMEKLNVVVLVLESFSKELIGGFGNTEGLTPFYDSLMKQSYLFSNGIAAGTRSSEGVPAVLGSMPSLMPDNFVFSAYQINKNRSLGFYLGEVGYATSFFHGGQNSTMNFESYIAGAGYQRYFGRNEFLAKYPKHDNAEDGPWGINDFSFLDLVLDEINNTQPPFHAAWFTLEPHHPFHVPQKYKERYKELHPRKIAMRYADDVLRAFFYRASKETWFRNTLFVLSPDHTGQPYLSGYYEKILVQYQIPIMFYKPNDPDFVAQNNQTVSQLDVLPSTLALLNYSKPYTSFGKNIFSGKSSYCVFQSFGKYFGVQDSFVLQFDNAGSRLFNLIADIDMQNDLSKTYPEQHDSMLLALKSRLQVHHAAMNKNKLVLELNN